MLIPWIIGLAFVVWYASTRKQRLVSPFVMGLLGLVVYIFAWIAVGGIAAFISPIFIVALLINEEAVFSLVPFFHIAAVIAETALATTAIKKIVGSGRAEASEEGQGASTPLPREKMGKN